MLTVGKVVQQTHNQAISLHVCVSLQLEAAGCDPLDELYDALAEVVGTEDTNQCYKSYLLVLIDLILHTRRVQRNRHFSVELLCVYK